MWLEVDSRYLLIFSKSVLIINKFSQSNTTNYAYARHKLALPSEVVSGTVVMVTGSVVVATVIDGPSVTLNSKSMLALQKQ